MWYLFQIQDFNTFRLIRINNTNKASTQIWALLKTASIKVMAGGKHSFHMCATQNLHIWPPLFSSRLSFRAHVIEKPPASAKKAHSGKFFLKQPTSQLWAVFWLSACQDSDSLPPAFFPLSPPSLVIDQAAPQGGEGGGLTLGRGRESLQHTSAPPPLLPHCLLVSQQRFTTCYGEGSEAHSWQDTRLSQWKYHWWDRSRRNSEVERMG